MASLARANPGRKPDGSDRGTSSTDDTPPREPYGALPVKMLEDERLTSADRCLLLAMDSYGWKVGRCFASGENLARRSGLSRRTVGTRLRRLVELGIVVAEDDPKNPTGRCYRLPWRAVQAPAPSAQPLRTSDRPQGVRNPSKAPSAQSVLPPLVRNHCAERSLSFEERAMKKAAADFGSAKTTTTPEPEHRPRRHRPPEPAPPPAAPATAAPEPPPSTPAPDGIPPHIGEMLSDEQRDEMLRMTDGDRANMVEGLQQQIELGCRGRFCSITWGEALARLARSKAAGHSPLDLPPDAGPITLIRALANKSATADLVPRAAGALCQTLNDSHSFRLYDKLCREVFERRRDPASLCEPLRKTREQVHKRRSACGKTIGRLGAYYTTALKDWDRTYGCGAGGMPA